MRRQQRSNDNFLLLRHAQHTQHVMATHGDALIATHGDALRGPTPWSHSGYELGAPSRGARHGAQRSMLMPKEGVSPLEGEGDGRGERGGGGGGERGGGGRGERGEYEGAGDVAMTREAQGGSSLLCVPARVMGR